MSDHLYVGNGVEDGRNRSVCMVRSEKSLETFGKYSIDFLRKLYRLSGKTL